MLQRLCEAIQAVLPEDAVAGEPVFQLAERLGPQGIQALLPERAHRDEARFIQYPQVSGYPGLVDAGVLDDLTYGLLAGLQGEWRAANSIQNAAAIFIKHGKQGPLYDGDL